MVKNQPPHRDKEKSSPSPTIKQKKAINESKDRPVTLSDRTTLRHKDGQQSDNNNSKDA